MENPEKIIIHKGEKYFWKCHYANGAYYENERSYVLTNSKGKVDFASRHVLEMRGKNDDKP